jgi:hypothetical protein
LAINRDTWGRIVVATVFCLLWCEFLVGGLSQRPVQPVLAPDPELLLYVYLYDFFTSVLWAPFTEEVYFRLLAIGLPMMLLRRASWPVWLSAILVGGAAFGLVHAHPLGLILQGGYGVAWGWLFIRTAEQRPENVMLGGLCGYWACVISHALVNFIFTNLTFLYLL